MSPGKIPSPVSLFLVVVGASATRSAAYLDGKGSYEDYEEYEEGEFDDYDYDSDTTFDEYEVKLGFVSEEPIEVKGSCELCSEREMHKSMKMMNGVCLDHKHDLLITKKVPNTN
nr:hypothetical protein [Tanacetum cinerariifolium]